MTALILGSTRPLLLLFLLVHPSLQYGFVGPAGYNVGCTISGKRKTRHETPKTTTVVLSSRTTIDDGSPRHLSELVSRAISSFSGGEGDDAVSTDTISPIISSLELSLSYLSTGTDDHNYLLLLLSVLNRRSVSEVESLLSGISSPELTRSFSVVEDAINSFDSVFGGRESWLEDGGGKNQSGKEDLKFETWEEVKFKEEFGDFNAGKGDRETSSSPSTRMKEMSYYEILDVEIAADNSDIKSSYRNLAKKYHPDALEGGNEVMFKIISEAYTVLSDPASRKLYDHYGKSGLNSADVRERSKQNEDALWDEIVREGRRKGVKMSRRDIARRASKAEAEKYFSDSSLNDDGFPEPPWEGSDAVPVHFRTNVARVGSVVKYPLSDVARSELVSDREFGLGLVVGRNIDRGDVEQLLVMNEDQIDLCEVTPLVMVDDGVFEKDELGSTCFPRLGELERSIEIVKFNSGFDRWHLRSKLGEDLSQYSDDDFDVEGMMV